MEEYTVKKQGPLKIEDNATYQKYSMCQVKAVPPEDIAVLLKLFLDKAAINMGKECYDAPDATRESILEFAFRDFGILPVYSIGSAIVRGSLGKYGPGRLVPQTVYRWFTEMTIEYERNLRHERLTQREAEVTFDLNKYPVGSAIIKKIEWVRTGIMTMDEWDRVSLKTIAELIKRNGYVTYDMI